MGEGLKRAFAAAKKTRITPYQLASAFKGGLTRSQVAKKFDVSIITVDNAIMACLRGRGKR